MKKFLSAISLLLVLTMIMAVPTFGTTEPATETATPDYQLGYGTTYNAPATKAKPIVIDGKIDLENEGWTEITYDAPEYSNNFVLPNAATKATPSDELLKRAAKFSFYVANDEDNFYFAYLDDGQVWDIDGDPTTTTYEEFNLRTNRVLKLGFNLGDYTEYVFVYQGYSENYIYSFSPTDTTSGFHVSTDATIDMDTAFTVKQSNWYGDYTFVDNKIDYTTDANKNVVKTDHVKGNCFKGDYELYTEFAIDKDILLSLLNMNTDMNYAELPNAMFVSFAARSYTIKSNLSTAPNVLADSTHTDVVHFGNILSDTEKAAIGSRVGTETVFPDLIVFGDEVKVPAARTVTTDAHALKADVGQNIHYVGSQNATPIMDGIVNPSEYSYSTKLTSSSAWASDTNFTSIGNRGHYIKTANYDCISDSIEFFFASDDENVYISLIDIGGHWEANSTRAGNNFRNNYHFFIGFDMENVTNHLTFGGMNPKNQWLTAKFYNGTEYKTHTAGTEDIVTKLNTTKFAYDAATGTVGKELGKTNDNAKVPYIMYVEMALNKDKLLECFNKYTGTNYAELPDTMFFAMGTRSYMFQANNSSVHTYDYPLDSMWMATAATEAQKTAAGTKYFYVPDIVVFDDADAAVKAPCNFTAEVANETTLMATCTSPDLYYKTCVDCGQKADGSAAAGGLLATFTTTADVVSEHTPGAAATADTPQICTQCRTELVPALGHTHNYGAYQMTATTHWQECACGVTMNSGSHNFVAGNCTECGYVQAGSTPVTPVTPPPADTTPVETQPVETKPVETTPVETKPVETTPVETTPVETTPVETTPVETTPVETTPVETTPVETEPAEGGCGSTVTFAGLALVAALGTCAVFATRKKDEE